MENQCGATWIQWSISVFGLFVLYWVCKLFLQIGRNKFLLKGFFCRIDFEKIVLPPLKIILLSFAGYSVVALVSTYFECVSFLNGARIIRDIMVIGGFSWMAYRWKGELFQERRFLRAFSNLGIAHAVSKLTSAVIVIVTGLMILRIFSLDVIPLLAFGGIGAAALGFAAKDVIGNFFGGAMLSVTRPFSNGDHIFLPDRDIEGVVEELGWYLTSIRDKDRRPVYLPNSLFSSFLVVNLSRMSHRRIRETLWIRYSDFSKIAAMTESIRLFLQTHKEIDPKAPILVYLNRLGEYSLEIYLDAYTFATELGEYLAVKERILGSILALIQEMGARISYPVSSVHIVKEESLL